MIESIKTMKLKEIRYGNLQRNIGDAVWIDIRVEPLAPPIVDLEGPTTTAGTPQPGPTTPTSAAAAAAASAVASTVIKHLAQLLPSGG